MGLMTVIPPHVREWGTDIIWVATVVAAFAALVAMIRKTRIGRFSASQIRKLYRIMFGSPVSSWFARVVSAAVADEISALRTENTEQHAHTSARLDDVVTSVNGMERRMAGVEAYVHDHSLRLDRGAERMGDLATAQTQIATSVSELAQHLSIKEHT